MRPLRVLVMLLMVPCAVLAQSATFFDDPAKVTIFKAAVAADPVMNVFPITCCDPTSGSAQLAAYLNDSASPAFTVWKTRVALAEIGNVFLNNGSELAGLTTGDSTRLGTIAYYLLSSPNVNPSIAGHRAFYDGVFSGAGGQNTRAALLVLYKRTARRIEKMFATGTGSDASPATMTWEGPISASDVQNVRSKP